MAVTARVDDVTIAIARDPALVRTARLVAAAVARRSDLDEALVEEIRLAVGEACAVLIGLDSEAEDAPRNADGEQVTVTLGAEDGFRAVVSGRLSSAGPPALDSFELDLWGLLRGIDESLVVEQSGDHVTVTVRWPSS